MSKTIEAQWTLEDLFQLIIDDMETTRTNWISAKPGIKVACLRCSRNYLDKLIRIAEAEREESK